jgi:hypothetical protein
MFGLVVIYIENHFDGKAITCQNGADNYVKAYCWLHGTGYLGRHLQGQATGCYVDQSRFADGTEDDRVTSYYLWLPSLFLVCFALAKMGRLLWRTHLEGGILKAVLQNRTSIPAIVQAFVDFQPRFGTYQWKFVVCEVLNLASTLFSFFITDRLLGGKFWTYGIEAAKYYAVPAAVNSGPVHDPLCEVFPTEVSCKIQVKGRFPPPKRIGCLKSASVMHILGFKSQPPSPQRLKKRPPSSLQKVPVQYWLRVVFISHLLLISRRYYPRTRTNVSPLFCPFLSH